MATKELNGHQARWVEKLSMFDFILEHHPGKKNPADVPSCQPDYTCEAVAKSMLRTLQEKLSHSVLSSG